MSMTTNKFAPEVRERAVRMVFDRERDYASRCSAVVSIAEKIGCVRQTLHESVRRLRSMAGSAKLSIEEFERETVRLASQKEVHDLAGEERLAELNVSSPT